MKSASGEHHQQRDCCDLLGRAEDVSGLATDFRLSQSGHATGGERSEDQEGQSRQTDE